MWGTTARQSAGPAKSTGKKVVAGVIAVVIASSCGLEEKWVMHFKHFRAARASFLRELSHLWSGVEENQHSASHGGSLHTPRKARTQFAMASACHETTHKHIVSFFCDKVETKGDFFEITSRPSAFGKRRIKMDSVMNEHACKGDLRKTV